MKILVCISKTPDTTAKITFTDNNTKFDEQGVQFIVNPSDEWYALVRALELKEALGGTVHLITVGGPDNDPVIRKALALGADDAIRVDTDASDGYYVAAQIAHCAREGGYDLLLTGKETIDYNGSGVGGMIAGILELPYISLATKLETEGNGEATVRREIEGGEEVCSVKLPAVISCMKGMAEQRIANVRNIMMAGRKPLKVVEPVDADKLTEIISFTLPEPKSGIKMIAPDNVEELVRLLHEEAKVI
ncbi:MAG TPA: electron transfer flavoprotein subunit beta/FixA family protein [Chitinophagaceae bacterium]|nr:electron transfer flavoprotein subunit beta/FixA family protein [Chitinophagaceae bacterium]